MNPNGRAKLALLLLLVSVAVGQEAGEGVPPVVDNVAVQGGSDSNSSAIVENGGEDAKQEEAAKVEEKGEEANATLQNEGSKATEQVQTAPEIAALNPGSPSAEASPSSQPQVETVPESSSNPPKYASTPPADHSHDVLSNLNPEQQAKLLEEQAIRAQLHANQDLSLASLANLTSQHLLQLQKKLAQESRAAYERGLKQNQQREAREKLELQQLLEQAKLTKSNDILLKQKIKVRTFMHNWDHSANIFNDFMFDMDPYTEQDFMISLPVTQKIGYLVSIYSNKDGVYYRQQQIGDDEPISIKIIENNNAVINEDSFYTERALQFEGRESYSYTFRFSNSNKHRLISFKLSHVLERRHLDGTITLEDVKSHSERARGLYNSMNNRFMGLDSKVTLENSNRRKLTGEIKQYYIYTLVEMVVFIGLALLQIELIRKLLASASIV